MRYAAASEFVREYAENISRGGLFIPDAHHLTPLTDVEVEIDLPGQGRYTVKGVVAHVLDADLAARCRRRPGAGIEIRKAPKGFREALDEYLVKLGSRRDFCVLVGDPACAKAVADAGYDVAAAPPPEDLARAFVEADHRIIACVVPRARSLAYRQAAAALGAGDIVVDMDSPAELDRVLERLDAELL